MKLQFKLFLCFILMLLFANYFEAGLKEKKVELYPKTDNALEKSEEPEQVIGSIMLGGFRVFVADLLWLRMITLEETGDYHELIMTANLISTLQPNYTSVWEYLGFVLSNNISSKETDPQLKLEWVKSAIDYLYKGLKRNPDSGKLYVAMSRTINDKLGINKERLLNHYFALREEGKNPHEMARFNSKEAIKTNNYTVHSERLLHSVNSYWVKESIFHIRNITKKHCLLAKSVLSGENEEQFQKLKFDYDSYVNKYGAEATIEEVSRRIKESIETLNNNIKKYPNQMDFQVALENHTKEYIERYSIAENLANIDAEMGKIIKNGKQNLKDNALSVALLEIEIILLRIKLLENEYNMDENPNLMGIILKEAKSLQTKVNQIKEGKIPDESQK